ncbi:uncharacterized protein LOC122245529 isoform X2 [Penaeus japonicus]|uniref:uncharacterized protein LOC122245529 isoform X2 n=1 Tax=Penaeus japonicus TaxID=27405 RepID=UPI001C714870|nr:uncharacterized protein LOC122245529 isoform X2 [Penaeus japonicus]
MWLAWMFKAQKEFISSFPNGAASDEACKRSSYPEKYGKNYTTPRSIKKFCGIITSFIGFPGASTDHSCSDKLPNIWFTTLKYSRVASRTSQSLLHRNIILPRLQTWVCPCCWAECVWALPTCR